MAALGICTSQAFAGAIAGSASRVALGANDLVQWGTAADDFTTVSSPYNRVSTGGVSVDAQFTGGFTIFVQNGSAFVGNFSDGEILLDTFFTDGPISLVFGSAVRGLGFNIINENFGAFTGSMAFYGAGDVLFDTVTVDGTSSDANDGSAPFLGGTSSLRDIFRVDISVSASLGGQALAINQLSLLTTDPSDGGNPGGTPTVPEPATLSLVSLALAGLAMRRRNRQAAVPRN
jgi:hypothetical protein